MVDVVAVKGNPKIHELRPMFNLEQCVTHNGGLVYCDWHPAEALFSVHSDTGLISYEDGRKCLSAMASGREVQGAPCDPNDKLQQWRYEPFVPSKPS
jgi:hypothetical protein